MANVYKAVVVLYDPATGDIVHGHYCEAESQSDLPNKAELERTALERAKRHAKPGTQLARAQVLHVDPAGFEMNRLYRVDPKAKTLVEAKAG